MSKIFFPWLILNSIFNANMNDGYLPNSPSTASRLHLLCTDRSSLHIFWFNTSKWRLSQDFNKASFEAKLFLDRMLGNQNSQEYRAIGLIRLSKSWKARETGKRLYLYKILEIANHARLALSYSSLVAYCIEPDDFKQIPRYW